MIFTKPVFPIFFSGTKENEMNRYKSTGVTIIELLITLGIIAIVASLAYPAYKGYTVVANRSEGKIALNEIAMAQERFFGNNNTYTIDISQLPGFTANPVVTDKGFYSISGAVGATGNIATSFTLTATPLAGQLNDSCTSITLTSTGVKGGSPTKSDCW